MTQCNVSINKSHAALLNALTLPTQTNQHDTMHCQYQKTQADQHNAMSVTTKHKQLNKMQCQYQQNPCSTTQ